MSEFKPITTQEEFDAAIKERLSREKAKYSDYDQLKSLVEDLKKENVDLKSTIEADRQSKVDADKQLEEMQSQIAGYETASLRTRVALQYGLPYDLADRLQGTDEESLKADAERLAGFMKSKESIPPLKTNEPSLGDDKDAALKGMLHKMRGE